jgi:Arc/MetJ-type ribon-helix-helix transcriptional regulator
MNITLTPELEESIREKIDRGDYDNADAPCKKRCIR